MVFFSHGYVVYDSGAASNHIDLSVSLTAGQFLTRLSIKGTLSPFAASGALAAGTTLSDQFCCGVQYGPAGYGGTPLTTGNIGTASWVTWGDFIRGATTTLIIPGTVPFNVWSSGASEINLDWKGSFYCPQNLDFYTAFGCNPSQAINFIVNYRFYCEWAGP